MRAVNISTASLLLFALRASGLRQTPLQQGIVKVPVVLGVMSQCPDAMLCESVFDSVVEEVGEKFDLSLTFIGTTNSSDPNFGVTCKHGPGECAGNVQELCALQHEPFEKWWPFVQCQNKHPRPEIGTPTTTLHCAADTGIDWAHGPAGACAGADGRANGEEGIRLLRESVKVTAEMGITTSCTIVVNGRHVCILDSEWYSCPGGHEVEDFVRQIEHEYDILNGRTGQ